MSDDKDLQRLRQLGLAQLDELKAERVRRLAQLVFADERRLMGRPWQRRAGRAWSGVIVPTLLAAACIVYLVWAVDFAAALYR